MPDALGCGEAIRVSLGIHQGITKVRIHETISAKNEDEYDEFKETTNDADFVVSN